MIEEKVLVAYDAEPTPELEPCLIFIHDMRPVPAPSITMDEYAFGEYLA